MPFLKAFLFLFTNFAHDIGKTHTAMNDNTDIIYMRRCLQLAAAGMAGARPNPMVGAVITARGRIIGEGYHVRCGEAHAEVNAFGSVAVTDLPLLSEATVYVSLEPCAHYGKTPPCADLIVSKGVRRVVVGCADPFAKVAGRGIDKLRNAGIDVTVGVLEDECRELNRRFMTFNEHKRPYIILKWAQTAAGLIDNNGRPLAISTPMTKMLVHKLRSECDAILVGRTTYEREHPMLDTRHWSGRAPMPLVLSHGKPCLPEINTELPMIPQLQDALYRRGMQSLLVEGGAETLQSFISAGAWDEIRVETAPITVSTGTRAPQIPYGAAVADRRQVDGNTITTYRKAR